MRVALDTAFESWWGAENAARAMPEQADPGAELVATAPPPSAPPPVAPDRETVWAAGVLWRSHAAYLAKQGAAPDFTAEQLASALEVDKVDTPTRARDRESF